MLSIGQIETEIKACLGRKGAVGKVLPSGTHALAVELHRRQTNHYVDIPYWEYPNDMLARWAKRTGVSLRRMTVREKFRQNGAHHLPKPAQSPQPPELALYNQFFGGMRNVTSSATT